MRSKIGDWIRQSIQSNCAAHSESYHGVRLHYSLLRRTGRETDHCHDLL